MGDRVGVILVGGFEGDAEPQSTLSHFSHIVKSHGPLCVRACVCAFMVMPKMCLFPLTCGL